MEVNRAPNSHHLTLDIMGPSFKTLQSASRFQSWNGNLNPSSSQLNFADLVVLSLLTLYCISGNHVLDLPGLNIEFTSPHFGRTLLIT